MAAHKHAEMIKAKADNMELAVFMCLKGFWTEITNSEIGLMEKAAHNSFFLCLPQHKDAVLNLLNGGRSQVNYGEYWSECNCNEPVHWFDNWWYMDSKCESRIKPHKEKRWIVYDSLTGNVYGEYKSYEDALDTWPKLQIIEIEVEV